MWQELEAFRRQPGVPDVDIECVDIADAVELEREFGRRVPVLEAGGTEICAYFFDGTALQGYLRRTGIAV